MTRILSGETLAKLTIVFCFLVSYVWMYQTMTRDEHFFERFSAKRFEMLEKGSLGYLTSPGAQD